MGGARAAVFLKERLLGMVGGKETWGKGRHTGDSRSQRQTDRTDRTVGGKEPDEIDNELQG
jgi:hypothetical protein